MIEVGESPPPPSRVVACKPELRLEPAGGEEVSGWSSPVGTVWFQVKNTVEEPSGRVVTVSLQPESDENFQLIVVGKAGETACLGGGSTFSSTSVRVASPQADLGQLEPPPVQIDVHLDRGNGIESFAIEIPESPAPCPAEPPGSSGAGD